jgi:hypothetical protein
MVLADAVHIDPGTHKRFILGTFSTLASESFPAQLNLSVYYGITDAETGEFEVTFRIVDSKHLFDDDTEPLFSTTIPINSPSPMAVCEGILTLRGLMIPAAGVYHCELLYGNEVLMARRLVAVGIEQAEQK